ncbi:MAG: ParB/RepB/Spo0J family partition protein [Firmicutes bacterium]|nr:ParB/RepB/Spo0J family partition protein [Bacillota bacterium]
MAKQRGLGRGLSSLIPERVSDVAGDDLRERGDAVSEVDVHLISANRFQPRRVFREDELAELAESVRAHGVIQPVLLRPVGSGYELVAGERRVRAARMAGLTTVPAVIRPMEDREALEVALIENLQRSDLNPIEESEAYRRLIEEFRWTQEEIGARVGKSRSHIANYLRLLQLEGSIQELLASQVITVAHAKVLLSIEGPRRLSLAERCAAEGWTVRQLELALKRQDAVVQKSERDDVHLKQVEAGLRRRFGTKVTVRGDSQKGRIEIPYRSLEELERLLMILNRDPDPDPGQFVV